MSASDNQYDQCGDYNKWTNQFICASVSDYCTFWISDKNKLYANGRNVDNDNDIDFILKNKEQTTVIMFI